MGPESHQLCHRLNGVNMLFIALRSPWHWPCDRDANAGPSIPGAVPCRRHSPTMFKATTTSALAHLPRPSHVRALSRSWTRRSPHRIADCTVRYGHHPGLERAHWLLFFIFVLWYSGSISCSTKEAIEYISSEVCRDRNCNDNLSAFPRSTPTSSRHHPRRSTHHQSRCRSGCYRLGYKDVVSIVRSTASSSRLDITPCPIY